MNIRIPAAVLLLLAPISAQFVPLVPFPVTLDLMIVDSTLDGVWRLSDRTQDGDYDDASEVSRFYDDQTGGIVLTNPTCIAVSSAGVVFVGDTSVDQIVSLEDKNGDGDANDPGEHSIFFDSATNASGITMASVQGMTIDALGNMFLAVSNSGSSGDDMILRLRDANMDGDANDLGEASAYCVIPNASGSVGDSIPTKVVVGPDLNLYYTDVGATGAVTKGVYRLQDINSDGDCNDPGEVQLFWVPTTAGNPFYWGLAVLPDGTFYVTDHGNEQVFVGRDANADGMISGAEARVFHNAASGTWWDILLRDDGKLLICEDQSPDRILALEDLNQDGDADDPMERIEVYSELSSPVNITRPRAAAFMRGPSLVVQPSVVQLGSNTRLSLTTGVRNEPLLLLFALGTSSTPFPPFGTLGLDQSTLTLLVSARTNMSGEFGLNIGIPNDSTLVRSWPFQAVSGSPFRPYLSNPVSLTVTR